MDGAAIPIGVGVLTAAAFMTFIVWGTRRDPAWTGTLDQYSGYRTPGYLGAWFHCQQSSSSSKNIALQGPSIKAGLRQGFCGQHVVHLSRIPLCRPPGRAGWAVLLAIFHVNEVKPIASVDELSDSSKDPSSSHLDKEENIEDVAEQWKTLETTTLFQVKNYLSVPISRASLITMLVVTNARTIFTYSDASGLRAAYSSYTGQWFIDWPSLQHALVRFVPHDSHSVATDVYPPSFMQRVDRCLQMVAGIVVGPTPSSFQVAFCGRKEVGTYKLEYTAKGYAGAHGSRHLYNMLGGKVYEVDYLFARRLEDGCKVHSRELKLSLPSLNREGSVTMIVPPREQEAIAHALDVLPWNQLSWSIHRGLRDILLAYAQPTMDKFRQRLAALLKQTVEDRPQLFDAGGWDPEFVRHSMGDMAASAILAGEGNSGDLVRVVTAIVREIVEDWTLEQLDEVTFWRLPEQDRKLDLNGIVALTKVFIVEWSNEFDYQMYHELPTTLYLG